MAPENAILSTTHTDILVPTDIDGNIITDKRRKGYLGGALHEALDFFRRNGHFKDLVEHGVVSSGKYIIVDSDKAIPLVIGRNVRLPVNRVIRLRRIWNSSMRRGGRPDPRALGMAPGRAGW